MSAASTVGKKIVRTTNAGINLVVLTVLIFLIAYGSYALWDSYDMVERATPENYAVYKPTKEGRVGYEELRGMNPDVKAWLTVYGTNIDYPVLQGEDNWSYINYDAFGKYSLTGSIFMDYQCSADFSDFNTILYGHNMTPKAMFGGIKDFKEKAFFDSHKYGDLYIGERHYGLEFFALLSTEAYNYGVYTPHVEGEQARLAYLDTLKSLATFQREVSVSSEDRIVLLSTCSSGQTNARDILVARINDTPYENEFFEEDETKEVTGIEALEQGNLLKVLPSWAWILIIVLIVLLIITLLVIPAIQRYRRRKRNES